MRQRKKDFWRFFISYLVRSHGFLEILAQAEPIPAILARVMKTAIIVVYGIIYWNFGERQFVIFSGKASQEVRCF